MQLIQTEHHTGHKCLQTKQMTQIYDLVPVAYLEHSEGFLKKLQDTNENCILFFYEI